MSFAVEVTQDRDPREGEADHRSWSGNALRFETRREADTYRFDLSMRWFGYTSDRVVESDDPVSHHYAIASSELVDVPALPCRECAYARTSGSTCRCGGTRIAHPEHKERRDEWVLVPSPRPPYTYDQMSAIVGAFPVAGEALDRMRERAALSAEPAFLVAWEREYPVRDLPESWQSAARRITMDASMCVVVVGHRKITIQSGVRSAMSTEDTHGAVYGGIEIREIPSGGCVVTGLDRATLNAGDHRPRVHVRAIDAARVLAPDAPELAVIGDMLAMEPPRVTLAEDAAREILATIPERDAGGLDCTERAILVIYHTLKPSHRQRKIAHLGYITRADQAIARLLDMHLLVPHGKGTKLSIAGKRLAATLHRPGYES